MNAPQNFEELIPKINYINMRITKINIPKKPEDNDGLELIKMDKLGPMVLIAGKNGSGKTRILNKIFKTIESKPTLSQVFNAKEQKVAHKRALPIHENALKSYQDQLTKTNKEWKPEIIERNIADQKKDIDNNKNGISLCDSTIHWQEIETTELSENYLTINFVPKELILPDSSTFANSKII